MSSGKRASFISQTFSVRTEFQVDGSYFKLLTSAAGSQVELYSGGVQILVAPAAKSGFYQRVDFDRVVITPSVNQLVEFLAAPDQGGSDAFTANSAITSPLDSDNADGAALLGANGLVAIASRLKAFNGTTYDRLRLEQLVSRYALRTAEQGYSYGATYISNSSIAANGTSQVFAAASNVNGAIVWDVDLVSASASQVQTVLLAKATPPTTVIDGVLIAQAMGLSGAVVNAQKRAKPVLVPAGLGLFFFALDLETNPVIRSVHYTLL